MINESATAVTTAPPSPCTARAATSSVCEFESPQASRCEGEQRKPDQEQPAMSVEIAQPAAEQQEAAEGEHVRVHDPHQRGLGESRDPRGSTAGRRSRSSCRGRSSGPRHTGRKVPTSACARRCCLSLPASPFSSFDAIDHRSRLVIPRLRSGTRNPGSLDLRFRDTHSRSSRRGIDNAPKRAPSLRVSGFGPRIERDTEPVEDAGPARLGVVRVVRRHVFVD